MGRIIVLENPFDPEDRRVFAHSGPYIDFLEKEFPAGFHGQHLTLFNLNRLAVENYDTVVGEGDTVVLSVMPGFDPVTWSAISVAFTQFSSTWVGQAIIMAAISTALSFAINALFGPKAAKPDSPQYTNNLPSPDTVYTFSGSSNTARIGEVIPVGYGRNPMTPDLAMQPYQYFENNQQYLVLLECLGEGTYDIHEMTIAGSDVSVLGSDIIDVQVYPPSAHASTFGIIQNALGRYENVYTSPSVSDQELYASSGTGFFTSTGQIWNGCFYDGENCGGLFWTDKDCLEYADALHSGRVIWMTTSEMPNPADNMTTPVGFIAYSGWGRDRQVNFRGHKGHRLYLENWPGGGGNGIISLSYSDPTTIEDEEADYPNGGLVGPYIACPANTTTSYLQYDLVFPNGCYMVSTSNTIQSFDVSVRFTAEPIDENNAVINDPVNGIVTQHYDFVETFATNSPIRRTLHHYVPNARYQVSAQRLSNVSDRPNDQSKCYWTGLKSILGNTLGTAVYGDVTLLSVKIRATEGLASNAHERLLVDATRTKNGSELRNPIDAFSDIFTNMVYGGRRPTSELDLETLDAMKAGSWSGRVFDAVFDNATTVWDALKVSLQMQHAVPMTVGATLSIVEDAPVSVAEVAFSEDMITNLTLSYMFINTDEYDGVEGEYKNAIDNAPEYVTWPRAATNPETMKLWGCKDYYAADAFVQRYWKQTTTRRRMLTIETELDGCFLSYGTAIDVTHRLLGETPWRCIISSIEQSEDFKTTIEAYVYEPSVFES